MIEFVTSFIYEILSLIFLIIISLISIPVTIKSFFKKDLNIENKNNKLIEYYNHVSIEEIQNDDNFNRMTPNDGQQNNFEDNNQDLFGDNNSLDKLWLEFLIELREKRDTDKQLKKISFILAVAMSVTGSILLLTGLVLSLMWENKLNWVTVASGTIIELVSGLYFWLVNRTTIEVRENNLQIEKTKDQITAIKLIERINNDEKRNDAYKEMILKLISY